MNRPLDLPKASRSAGALDWAPRLYLPLLIALCVVYSWHPVLSTDDLWAHVSIGRWIVQHGQVPHQALMLWTSTEPWIAHSWLSQVVFFVALTTGGPPAIVGLTVLCSTLPFALLWRSYTRRHHPSSAMLLLFALGIQCSWQRFIARPELFSAVFLTLLFVLLLDYADPIGRNSTPPVSRPVVLFALPPIFVLWANLHGAVAVGLVLLVATAAAEWVQQRGRRPARLLAVATVACFLAVCVNPYGVHLWQALRPIQNAVFRDITEWRPFWQEPAVAPMLIVSQAALLLLALGAWRINQGRRWSHLLWLLLLSAAFVSARRYGWMLSLGCLAVLAGNVSDGAIAALRHAPGSQSASRGADTILLRIAALVCMAAWITYALHISPVPRAAVAGDYAVQLTHWERRLPPRSLIFNNSDESGFLHWRWGERQPLFVDLLNVYSDRLYFDYRDICNAQPRGLDILEHSPIEFVVMTTGLRQQYPPLVHYLVGSPHWKVIYHGPDGAIWMHNAEPRAKRR